MKKILAIAAIFSAFGAAFAQQPDAVFKLIRHEWTVAPDGTSDYHYRHEVQIMRNRALTAYADKGETFVVYNPDIEDLTVNEVYTIQADGRRVDMPQNAFVYQLPSECADCGRFNHLRELAMVHTGMELGCVVVVDYTLHRRFDLVNEQLELMRECPVERFEASITVPDGQELNVQFDPGYDGLPVGHIAQTSTATTYSLVANALPQKPAEPYMPDDLFPTLRLMNGTPQFTPAFDDSFSGAVEAMGQTMVSRDAATNIVAARDFVGGNIHLNDIDPKHLGYTHSTAAEVWQTGCGTATDKACLLAAILRAEGYRARVIGDDMDAVGVMIDTLEYRLDVRQPLPLALIGEAKDEVDSLNVSLTLDPSFDTLEGGFFRLQFPSVGDLPDARRLPLQRTMPFKAPACDITQSLTYNLPKGMKMVGEAVSLAESCNGVGELSVSVRQKGKRLIVERRLKLEGSIAPQDYAAYRRLLATWQSVSSILVKG